MAKRKWPRGEKGIAPPQIYKRGAVVQEIITHRCGHVKTYTFEEGRRHALWAKYDCFECQQASIHRRLCHE